MICLFEFITTLLLLHLVTLLLWDHYSQTILWQPRGCRFSSLASSCASDLQTHAWELRPLTWTWFVKVESYCSVPDAMSPLRFKAPPPRKQAATNISLSTIVSHPQESVHLASSWVTLSTSHRSDFLVWISWVCRSRGLLHSNRSLFI